MRSGTSKSVPEAILAPWRHRGTTEQNLQEKQRLKNIKEEIKKQKDSKHYFQSLLGNQQQWPETWQDENRPQTRHANALPQRIVAHSGLSRSASVRLVVVDDDYSINGTMDAGGLLKLKRGILRLNDSALAWVLAHEIGHLKFNHNVKMWLYDRVSPWISVWGPVFSAAVWHHHATGSFDVILSAGIICCSVDWMIRKAQYLAARDPRGVRILWQASLPVQHVGMLVALAMFQYKTFHSLEIPSIVMTVTLVISVAAMRVIGFLGDRALSRMYEYQADAFATRVISKAGITSDAGIVAIKRLEEESVKYKPKRDKSFMANYRNLFSSWSEPHATKMLQLVLRVKDNLRYGILSTHPSHEARIAAIKRTLDEQNPHSLSSTITTQVSTTRLETGAAQSLLDSSWSKMPSAISDVDFKSTKTPPKAYAAKPVKPDPDQAKKRLVRLRSSK